MALIVEARCPECGYPQARMRSVSSPARVSVLECNRCQHEFTIAQVSNRAETPSPDVANMHDLRMLGRTNGVVKAHLDLWERGAFCSLERMLISLACHLGRMADPLRSRRDSGLTIVDAPDSRTKRTAGSYAEAVAQARDEFFTPPPTVVVHPSAKTVLCSICSQEFPEPDETGEEFRRWWVNPRTGFLVCDTAPCRQKAGMRRVNEIVSAELKDAKESIRAKPTEAVVMPEL